MGDDVAALSAGDDALRLLRVLERRAATTLTGIHTRDTVTSSDLFSFEVQKRSIVLATQLDSSVLGERGASALS